MLENCKYLEKLKVSQIDIFTHSNSTTNLMLNMNMNRDKFTLSLRLLNDGPHVSELALKLYTFIHESFMTVFWVNECWTALGLRFVYLLTLCWECECCRPRNHTHGNDSCWKQVLLERRWVLNREYKNSTTMNGFQWNILIVLNMLLFGPLLWGTAWVIVIDLLTPVRLYNPFGSP